MDDHMRQMVFANIYRSLREAEKECEKFDDLKKNPGEKISKLMEEVRQMILREGYRVPGDTSGPSGVIPTRESTFLAISRHLQDAVEECAKLEDLKKDPREKIDKLLDEVGQMMMQECGVRY